MSEIEIQRDISSKLSEARNRIMQTDIAGALSLAIPDISTWQKIGQALMGSQPEGMPIAVIYSLLSIVFAYRTGERFLKASITDYSNTVKFIVTRETFYNINPVFGLKPSLLPNLISLARKFIPRPITEEYIRREMIKPWLDNPVWYDP